jgi:hypothetical protein
MKKGTPEGRRLFAVCVGIGVVAGVVAGALAATTFRHSYVLDYCAPDDPTGRLCKRLDVIGFELHSSWNAALTIGVVVALVAWVLAVVATLYSIDHRHHHPEQ